MNSLTNWILSVLLVYLFGYLFVIIMFFGRLSDNIFHIIEVFVGYFLNKLIIIYAKRKLYTFVITYSYSIIC